MTDTQVTDLAAELAMIRTMAAQITDDGHPAAECIADLGARCTGHDAERLADAVEAALAVVASWESKPAVLREARDLPPLADSIRAIVGRVLTEASEEMREAITRALLGED